MRFWQWLGILVVMVTMFLCAWFEIEQTVLFIFLAALLALIPFFISFEKGNAKPRDLMPVIVLSTLAIVGRLLFAAFPNFKPVTAIVIIAGISFGAESGFMTGALAALVSNIFMSQGPWTAWQMLAWGLVGFFAGVLAQTHRLEKSWQVLTYGILSSFLFGFVMDTWTLLGFVRPLEWQQVLLAYTMGIPFNLSHAVSTFLFLLVIHKPWLRQLERIKLKFGLSE